MQSGQKNPVVLMAALLALTACLEGCGILVMGRGLVIDEPFTEKKVQMIHHGETTKKEILDWFGPPFAVARPGTVMKVPHWSKSGTASSDVPAEDFFKRFTATRERVQRPLVYYYETAKLSWAEVYGYVYNASGPLYIPTVAERTLTVMSLWVLLDETSGKVADHRLEKTVEGKPQQEKAETPAAGAAGAEMP